MIIGPVRVLFLVAERSGAVQLIATNGNSGKFAVRLSKSHPAK